MPATTTSEALLTRLAKGDDTAMAAVIQRYDPLVRTIARRALGRDRLGELDDAVQEAFIAIWLNAHRFDAGKGAERTFIIIIVQRGLVDRHRRSHTRINPRSTHDAMALIDVQHDDRAAGARSDADVAQVLSRLLPRQQLVLELWLARGCTCRQIAQTLRWPVGTVKSCARRGLQQARRIMGIEHQQPMAAVVPA